jgi:hypothetical protein
MDPPSTAPSYELEEEEEAMHTDRLIGFNKSNILSKYISTKEHRTMYSMDDGESCISWKMCLMNCGIIPGGGEDGGCCSFLFLREEEDAEDDVSPIMV